MAYSETELSNYWGSVQDGSILNNAAPNNFQGSTGFTTNQTEDLQDIRDTSYADRQAAMDFSNKYKTEPTEAALLSDRLSGVLEQDSPYLQRARTKATEAAGSRGLLNSSMSAGAAEGAAIDRGLQVAKGDVEVDKFNAGVINAADDLEYKASQGFAGKTQDFQNQLGGNESDYLFQQGIADQKQGFDLETQQNEFDNKLSLQDSAAVDKMETDMLKYTNQRAMEILKQQSGLHAAYLDAYGQIAMSDISKADKDDQLEKLGQQITNAVTAAERYKDVTITGNNVPNYDITGI